MGSVKIDHPEEWIGIPEHFPNERWRTSEKWAKELVAAYASDFKPGRGQAKTLTRLLTTIADSRESLGASRLYATIDKWEGPLTIASMKSITRGPDDHETLEELGAHFAAEGGAVENFETTSGLPGRKISTKLDPAEASATSRMDYLIEVPDGFVQIFAVETNPEEFANVLPLLDALAKTVLYED